MDKESMFLKANFCIYKKGKEKKMAYEKTKVSKSAWFSFQVSLKDRNTDPRNRNL